jgi:hypothetical protein
MFSSFHGASGRSPIWSYKALGSNVRRDALTVLRNARRSAAGSRTCGRMTCWERSTTRLPGGETARNAAFRNFTRGLEVLDAADRQRGVQWPGRFNCRRPVQSSLRCYREDIESVMMGFLPARLPAGNWPLFSGRSATVFLRSKRNWEPTLTNGEGSVTRTRFRGLLLPPFS